MKVNLKEIRKKYGYSQKDVADALNVTQGSVSAWEQGRWFPDISSLVKLADLYGISIDTLLGRSSDIESPVIQTFHVKTSMIPIVARVRAKYDPFEETNIIGRMEVGEALVKMFPVIYAVEINNDALGPEIQVGDHAIISPETVVKDNDMAMVCIKNDDGIIRRVLRTDNGIELISDNDNYSTVVFTNDQVENLPVVIMGKVIGIHRFYR